MNISVTVRHMNSSDVTKEYARDKVDHLQHYFDRLDKVEVVINPEKDASFSAEIVLHAPKHTMVAHASGKTATAAVDLVVEKMERILTKHKEKLRAPKGSKTKAKRGAASEPAASTDEETTEVEA